jgi:hypothetical protein
MQKCQIFLTNFIRQFLSYDGPSHIIQGRRHVGGLCGALGCEGKASGVTSAAESGRLLVVTLIIVCLWVVFHLREWQTRGFDNVVARASEAPVQLRRQRHIILANSSPRGSILMNMVFDKIGEGRSWEKARSARLVRTILVAYVEPKRVFFFSSGKFSSAAPPSIYLATIYWKGLHTSIQSITKSCKSCQVNKKRRFQYGHFPSKPNNHPMESVMF